MNAKERTLVAETTHKHQSFLKEMITKEIVRIMEDKE